ncbi:IS110 family transposase [Paenibacillus sp. WQ 127069]|jgi:transposase|uniref:IS110 family transposase n=1 Tax=Paenibacillus baimaensis TaxID=2982185 RepID=A0ABT2UHP3_9BACL|nr:IS110 family transposase [Paenibacillus sp. WQ 127069]MCU6793641.1 IS110 family transposase [Paenibacillus sp. WQ 127069]
MGKSSHIQGIKGIKFSQQLRGINLEQVLIVAIDAAKLHQKALICNYFGDVIERPFFFSVSESGMQLLRKKIDQACAVVQAERLFLGIEATGHYYEDIVREMSRYGFHVQIFNPYSTFEERAGALNWCKTDDLDLVAIAHAIKSNKATQIQLLEGHHRHLLVLTRARRSEIRKRSTLRMEIRNLMDILWREFQGYADHSQGKARKIKVFSDFWGKASSFMMEHYPHPSMILQLGEKGLRELSVRHNLKLRQSAIQKLLHVAGQSLSRHKDELRPEFMLLNMKLRDLKAFNSKIEALDQEIESLLLQTDGRLLLTVPGLGVSTSAELYAEIGNIDHFTHAGQWIKKAGTNPMIKQTGGHKGSYGHISKQGNDHLRYVVFLVGRNLCLHNQDLKAFYERLKGRGKHERAIFIAMGNKMLKIAFALLRDKVPFHSQIKDYSLQDELNKKLKYNCFVTHLQRTAA